MKIYSHYGFNDFIICLGYKGYLIKEYFMHYYLHNSDITIEVGKNRIEVHSTNTESFKVTLVETGLNTKTAGRLQKIEKFLNDEDFMLTYGDGVADINIPDLIKLHKSHGKLRPLLLYIRRHALEEWFWIAGAKWSILRKNLKETANG